MTDSAPTAEVAIALDADRRRIAAIIALSHRGLEQELVDAIERGASVELAALQVLAAMRRQPRAPASFEPAYIPAGDLSDPVDEIYAARRAAAHPSKEPE
jgi:hypothetical protein